MIKFISWLGKAMISALLISFLTLYVAWSTVQLYMDKLLQQFHLSSDSGQVGFTDLLSKLSDNLNILSQGAAKPKGNTEGGTEAMPENSPQASAASPTAAGSGGGGLAAGQTGSQGGAVTGTDSAANGGAADWQGNAAMPAWSQAEGLSEQGAMQKKDLVMSADQFAKMKDELSSDDKMKIFSLLVGRVPQDDLQKLSAYVEDGITNDELEQVQAIVQKYLKPEEYQQLIAILNKY